MPIIQQKYNMFLNLAVSYFFARQKINVIPNIRFGSTNTLNAYELAIPKNSLIAIGTYGCFKTIKEKNLWFNTVLNIIKILEPKGIVVYGSLTDEIKNIIFMYGVECYVFKPYIFYEYRKISKK
jgi:hypothetical protein